MDRGRALGVALVLVSACGFGSGPIFAKPVYAAGVDWLTLLAWRFAFGASLSWAWLLLSRSRRAGLRRLSRRSVIAAIALGALYTANSGTFFAGLETVPASLAALIVYLYPAIVAVLSLRIGRRLQGGRAWSALGMALIGVALAVGTIDRADLPPVSGLLLVLASPVIYAIWIVLAARLSGERREEPEVHLGGGQQVAPRVEDGAKAAVATEKLPPDGADAAAATALMMTTTATAFWLASLASGRPVLPGQIPPSAWFGLAGVGVFSTFIAIQTFYAGAQRIGAAQAALLSTIEPAWTIGLAALVLGERLGPLQLAGGGLVLLAVVVAQTGSAAEGERARPAVRLADE